MKFIEPPKDNVTFHTSHINPSENPINLLTDIINLPLSRRAGEGGARREAGGG
ncbi:hypothetical protein GGE65_000314 [Skermanella aerolata]